MAISRLELLRECGRAVSRRASGLESLLKAMICLFEGVV